MFSSSSLEATTLLGGGRKKGLLTPLSPVILRKGRGGNTFKVEKVMHKDMLFNEYSVAEHLRYALMVLNSPFFYGQIAQLS